MRGELRVTRVERIEHTDERFGEGDKRRQVLAVRIICWPLRVTEGMVASPLTLGDYPPHRLLQVVRRARPSSASGDERGGEAERANRL